MEEGEVAIKGVQREKRIWIKKKERRRGRWKWSGEEEVDVKNLGDGENRTALIDVEGRLYFGEEKYIGRKKEGQREDAVCQQQEQ